MQKKLFNIVFAIGCSILTSTGYAAEQNHCQQLVGSNLCQKIGQMLIVGFGGNQQDDQGGTIFNDPNGTRFSESSLLAQDIRENNIGGIILFTNPVRSKANGEFIRDRNVQSPAQLKKLTDDIVAYAKKTRDQQLLSDLPLFISIDEEGGMVDRLPATLGFSKASDLLPQALGAAEERHRFDFVAKRAALQATYDQAHSIGELLSRYHINLDFAPDVDVNINPLNPIIGGLGRSFSGSPTIVSDQAAQYINGLHAFGIIATLKHFPGHGSSTGDSHKGFVDVTDTYQMSSELMPYQTLFNQGYNDAVMTTHVINGQIDRTQCKTGDVNDHETWCPGTLSKRTLNGLLRERLGFQGVVISDDMTMGAIAKEYPLSVAMEKGINAGVNIFILANNNEYNTTRVINTIAELVHDGKVSPDRINESYFKIVNLKQQIRDHQLQDVKVE